MKKTGWVLSIAAALVLILTGCSGTAVEIEPQGKVNFAYFDTVSYVYSYAGDTAERFEERSAAVYSLLGEYHQLFDIYHEYSGVTNLCTINKNAGGEALKVDQKLIDLLVYARELYEKTGGEMNIMMGAVLELWHDCREAASQDPKQARLPDQKELEEAARHTAFELLEIDEQALTVRIADPEASIDVGALGKGYAVEKAADWLREDGAESYVLNVGGNIRIIGEKPDGSGWVTGIKDPQKEDLFALRLNIKDTACVTSGVYERYFSLDGKRYHHIIDKDTLYPAESYASVTILTDDSGLADALSTALFCMSIEEGSELAESLGADVIWIGKDGSIEMTPGAKKQVI